MKCHDLCAIEELPNRTDDEILDLWSKIQSGDIETDDEWLDALFRETWKTRSLTPTIDLHKGELSLPVSEDDMRIINQGSLDPWVQPDSDRADFSYILSYAQTFAAYEYAERAGIDLTKFADDRAKGYYEAGTLPVDFVSLRCCLFFEIRRQRHAGLREDNWRYIQDLYTAVCAAYAEESPSQPKT